MLTFRIDSISSINVTQSARTPYVTSIPIYSNVIALVPHNAPPPAVMTVRLLNLDGGLFASAGFLPGFASRPWGWIVETLAREHKCSEDHIGCEDKEGGDFVTVNGERMYQVAIGAANSAKVCCSVIN
jgi:hypothetical protein